MGKSVSKMKFSAIAWAAIAAAFGALALVGLGYANRDLVVLAVTFGGVALGISCIAFVIDWAREGAGPAEEDVGSATEAFLVILGAIIIEGSIAFFFSAWYWLWVASPLVVGIIAAIVTRR